MSGAALVLAAHGSRQAPQVNARVAELAARLAERLGRRYATVRAAFHQGHPRFGEVLDGLAEADVTVVPLMTSRGYYADHVLPRELARNRRSAEVRLQMTAPVGMHPGIVPLSAARVAKLCERFDLDPHDTAVAVVGHGTPRHHRSRRATTQLASQLGYSTAFGQCFAVFLDDEPGLATVFERAERRAIVVLPFLIGAGPHALADIPNRLGLPQEDAPLPRAAQVHGRYVVCDRPIGDDDGLVDLIADLASGADLTPAAIPPRRALRLGTRASALARWQTEHVANRLSQAGHRGEMVEISTLGDRVRDRAIHELAGDAPFCDDLEHALGAGLIDLAVHSLKDVALHPPREFEIAAVLTRGDAREALVAQDGRDLAALPAGASVGTSSPRRAAQILALRPDLQVKPIRGPVDDRVRQVREGRFDAAVLALAGLQRLGIADVATEIFALDAFVPAPAQAALAVEIRAGDAHARALVRGLDDVAARIATTMELNVLRELEAGAPVAIAAHAQVTDHVRLMVRLIAPGGAGHWDILHEGRDPGLVQRAALAEARAVLAELAAEVRG